MKKNMKKDGKRWYRFCERGHCFSVKQTLTDDDKYFCQHCNKQTGNGNVDYYGEVSVRAESLEAAVKMYKEEVGNDGE